jgi:hypothetical protein
MFTRALHWSLSWAISILSILPHPIPLRSILILLSCVRVWFSMRLLDWKLYLLNHFNIRLMTTRNYSYNTIVNFHTSYKSPEHTPSLFHPAVSSLVIPW